MTLQNAVSALVAWRQNNSVLELWTGFKGEEVLITHSLLQTPPDCTIMCSFDD